MLDGLFTTRVHSCRKSRFVNSAFPNKKIWPKNWSLFMTNKFESKCLQKVYVSSKWEKEWYRKTTSYLEQPSRHFCQHFMRRTTQQSLLAINLASQQKTTKLYFSSQVSKQFKLLTVSFKPLRCCLRSDKLLNCHVWKFYKDIFLNFRVILSVNQIILFNGFFLMVSCLILLRSLCVYIQKQLFFLISVNSGFRNIYLAASRLGKHLATIHLDFKE